MVCKKCEINKAIGKPSIAGLCKDCGDLMLEKGSRKRQKALDKSIYTDLRANPTSSNATARKRAETSRKKYFAYVPSYHVSA